MGVASLILGILGITVFMWLGPLLGGIWAGALMGEAALGGEPVIITWPVWALGLGIGVGFPALSVLLGIGSLMKSDKKGVAIAGIVAGLISAVVGIALTWGGAATLDAVDRHVMSNDQAQEQLEQVQDVIGDPLNQQKILNRIEKARAGASDAPAKPEPMEPAPAPKPETAPPPASAPQP